MNACNRPFLLKPAAKDYLWGGSCLNDGFGKDIPMFPLAETWECSTHPDGPSRVAGTDESLSDLLSAHPDYLGTHPLSIMRKPELPILVKLIDAREPLSVQVHPNDEYAMANENGSLGKTEMWYVLNARKNAELIYGFNQNVTKEQVRKAVADGSIENLLNHISVHKDDVFYIESGIVHAIGAGILVAEIQESSNLTYRFYDYDRVDKNGKKRALHLDKALEVAKLSTSISPHQPMRVLRYRNGCASELLIRCKYFQVERLLLNTEVHRNLLDFRAESNSFHVLLCVDGCGVLFGDDITIPFFKGDCIFVPADSISMKLHGKAQILNISC